MSVMFSCVFSNRERSCILCKVKVSGAESCMNLQ